MQNRLRSGLKNNSHAEELTIRTYLPMVLISVSRFARAFEHCHVAAAALDPHLLVRLDSKSAPRARSFRERTEVRLLCVSDACALDALAALRTCA